MARQQDRYEKQFRKRLAAARNEAGFSQAAFAQRLGLTRDRYAKYETRSPLPIDLLPTVARLTGRDVDYIVCGTNGIGSTERTDPKIVELDDEEYIAIPVYDVRAAAGAGALNYEEEVESYNLYRLQWLRAVSKAPTKMLAIIEVDGDSMWPTLAHGDHILLDRAQDAYKRDGLYVLDFGYGLQVKRVTMHPTKKNLTIRSDNEIYESYHDIDPDEVRFVGRVIWIGRQV